MADLKSTWSEQRQSSPQTCASLSPWVFFACEPDDSLSSFRCFYWKQAVLHRAALVSHQQVEHVSPAGQGLSGQIAGDAWRHAMQLAIVPQNWGLLLQSCVHPGCRVHSLWVALCCCWIYSSGGSLVAALELRCGKRGEFSSPFSLCTCKKQTRSRRSLGLCWTKQKTPSSVWVTFDLHC